MDQKNKIEDTASFIKYIADLTNKYSDDDTVFFYRGECCIYDNPCCPNIFRENVLGTNSNFELSLLNAMRQNKLCNCDSYLQNAIDAQHGEFPSRLLDITYNCLIALYFAVTPYYHYEETKFDNDDGCVYVFNTNYLFSPNSKNIIDNYDSIIKKDKPWFNNQILFQKNHKFIDNTKTNNRIISQQGAFILFQGNDFEAIPSFLMERIIIDSKYKSNIRKELSKFFGINTGYIYPEITNLAKDLSNKSKLFINEEFNIKNEIKFSFQSFVNDINKFYDYITLDKNIKEKDNKFYLKIQFFEKIINSYKEGFINIFKSIKKYKNNNDEEIMEYIKKYKLDFNAELELLISNLENKFNVTLCPQLQFSEEELEQ